MRALAFAAVSIVALAGGGCSSDSGSSSSPETSLDGKKLSELTPAEGARFCATNRESFAALATGSCTLTGLDAPTLADCETAVNECRSAGATSGAVCQDAADTGPPDFSDCTALDVMQVESCLAEARTYFAALTCSSFGQEPKTAPSCLATLEQNCPALLTGGS